ncbi:MAG: pyruvate:ferredoxin (flavodoxin) oxidoreductase [Brevinematia bacterium]
MPKTMKTIDGNNAAAYVAYAFTEVATIYPITPSSTMAEYCDDWAAEGKKNMFGTIPQITEMQSEAGAAGAMHGALQAGSLATTFTASQGLLLMIPNMYKIAGELLPGVFHVSARTVATHALSIFGDHSDVMAIRQTGVALLATGSIQEILDLAPVAHLAAIKSRIPFLHFFDGFRTSHEVQKVELLDYSDYEKLLDKEALKAFRERSLSSETPVTRGTAQNPDIFFQARESCNKFYDAVPDVVEHYMNEMSKLTGREYHPFNYYGAPDAENIIVAMGSVTDLAMPVVDYLVKKGEKVGLIAVHLYRPFSAKYFFKVMPKTVKRIAVLDRTKEPGAGGEPLYLDVKNLFYGRENAPVIVGGRYGLSSKDTTPEQLIAVFENLKLKEPKNGFTVGIVDDVTFLSLPVGESVNVAPAGTYEAKFYGIGSDGTVGANKNSIKIIGDNTNKYAQAYFVYDSKKSGGVTVSHLRFGDKPIHLPYLVTTPDFVACHVPAYLEKFDMLKGLKKGGVFLLNSIWDEKEVLNHIPNKMKKYMAENDIKFYIINATKIAEEIGLPGRTNTIMQSAFFKVTNIIPYDLAVKEMKDAIKKTYGKKGDKIVNMNYAAVDRGGDVIEIKVDPSWKNLKIEEEKFGERLPDFIKKVMVPINRLDGDSLPVSAFVGREDGTFPAGTTQYEKRGIAVNVPEWKSENCIQCNQCAFVCPHSVIRPFLLDENELKNAPAGTTTIQAIGKGLEKYKYRIQVSVLDCTGCGNCVDVCPGKQNNKALEMKPLESQLAEASRWEYFDKNVSYKDNLIEKTTIKGSQFSRPLFEFSGACGGCGETPYIKVITQLFGERMIVANATGCSSIYGGSAPATPYRAGEKGKGVAWANSLFEDNAEYGYGMALAHKKIRNYIQELMQKAIAEGVKEELKAAFEEWMKVREDGQKSVEVSERIKELLKKESSPTLNQIKELEKYLSKKSIWIIGGDGWAYDIGYGGLDHVIASGEDINLLVLDTEVYSNTGGQSSKATPIAAIARFAASGKKIKKKDLGLMATTYGYVYVAQVAMGANRNQFLKAIIEAESYPGPSLIVAYSPCINHGLYAGMGKSQEEEKRAVECGYWHLWRYDPRLEKEGKNPFQLDSKEPTGNFREFLLGEVRFASLMKTFSQTAEELFKAAEEDAKRRYATYKRLAGL